MLNTTIIISGTKSANSCNSLPLSIVSTIEESGSGQLSTHFIRKEWSPGAERLLSWRIVGSFKSFIGCYRTLVRNHSTLRLKNFSFFLSEIGSTSVIRLEVQKRDLITGVFP